MGKRTFVLLHLIFALGLVSLVGLFPRTGNASGTTASPMPPTTTITPAAQEVYTGNIIYIGGSRGTATGTFTLTIDSYTPDNEVLRLTTILKDGKQNALLDAIDKRKLGRFQIDSNIGQDINAVWVSRGEEGERKVTALAQRWIGFFEARRGSRSLDYPFMYIDLYTDESGKGEGSLIPAAKVRYIGDRTIEVENFAIYPARLTNIRRR